MLLGVANLPAMMNISRVAAPGGNTAQFIVGLSSIVASFTDTKPRIMYYTKIQLLCRCRSAHVKQCQATLGLSGAC
jgi:hypothetical protein